MQFLRKENGSTLLMIIITIAILTVLGTTVLSLSIMNYNMKFTDTMMKRTQYYSESGVDQVYSILGYYVDEALKHAAVETEKDVEEKKEDMQKILDGVKTLESLLMSNMVEQITAYELYSGPDSLTPTGFMNKKLYLKNGIKTIISAINNDYNNEDNPRSLSINNIYNDFSGIDEKYDGYFIKVMSGSAENMTQIVSVSDEINNHDYHELIIDEDNLVRYYQERMNYHFKDYFDTKESNISQKIRSLEGSNNYVFLDDESDLILEEIQFTDILSYSENDGDANFDNQFIVKELTSTFTLHDQTQRTITTDLVVEAPKDLMPTKLNQSKYLTVDNPLWQYGLVTEKNLDFQDGDIEILGSIYALGTIPSGSYNLDPNNDNSPRNTNNYKGVMVSGQDTDVRILGDVVTQSFIQIQATAEGSTLTVKDGYIYCDSLATQSDPYTNTIGKENTINIINGNVYTKNDLILNGEDNHINIDGNYYGFIGRGDDYYKQSAIVINADIKNGGKSTLTITGNTPKHPISEDSDKEGIFIAGTTFVNDFFEPDPNNGPSNLFETGESIGIKGNYLAYAFPLSDTTGLEDGGPGIGMAPPTVGASSNLPLYYKVADTDENKKMTIEDKAKYFLKTIEDPNVRSYIENGDGNIDISYEKIVYSKGVVFGKNLDGGQVMDIHNSNANSMDNYGEQKILKDYVYLLNYLIHRETKGNPENFYGQKEDVESTIEEMKNAQVISNYSNIEQAPSPEWEGRESQIESQDYRVINIGVSGNSDVKEVAIFQGSNFSENILIAGDNSPFSSDSDGDTVRYNGENYYLIKSSNMTPDEMQGIIITSGKVAMVGDITFYGSIIAQNDIYIEGDNVKVINNEVNARTYLAQLIMESPKLSGAFSRDTIDPLGYSLDEVEIIESVEVNSGGIEDMRDQMRKNYNEYIGIRNWRIAE